MIKTKHTPDTWVFEHYCNLQEKLHGQHIKIKSVFNPTERTPSMAIYPELGEYKFKDFSTGRIGNKIELVAYLYNITCEEAEEKIDKDYSKLESSYEEVPIFEEEKYQVSAYEIRNWNELDAKFWTQFGIGSKLLGTYNVKPIKCYTLTKNTDSGIKELKKAGDLIYGYFKANGELYKIYQPKIEGFKFLNVCPYIQGADQLLYSKPTLVICSSLKDVMSLITLDLNVEAVAPNSENSILNKAVITSYFLKYTKVLTLFDNDKAGDLGMIKYEELYGIPGIYLNLSKDLSDSIRDFGSEKTKKYLKPLINNI